MKCDELKAYKGDVYIPVYGSIADAQVYLKKDVDAVIAELKAEVNNLLMQNMELCQALQVMYSAEEYTTLQAEIARQNIEIKESVKTMKSLEAEIIELKAKLESVQASMYADVVDANMENRRLKRALYKACANWAHHRVFVRFNANEKAWENMERKCLKKAEEYK